MQFFHLFNDNGFRMNTLAEILRNQIDALGYSDLKECARARDIAYELLRRVVSTGHLPKDKTLLQYAEKLEIDPKQLLQTAYREKAPDEMRPWFANRPALAAVSPDQLHMAPVLGRAACGSWMESYESEADEYEAVDVRDADAFFVIAEGDSMVGGNIPPKARLLVSPSARVSNGDIVLARRRDEEYTVKTYYHKSDGSTILQPLNPNYEPLLVQAGESLNVMRVTEVRIKL